MIRDKLDMQHGGLMRCCLASVAEWVERDPRAVVKDGDQIECTYCGTPMIVQRGIVRWDRERDEARE